MRYVIKDGKQSSPIINWDFEVLKRALLSGKVVAFPTDTVYGIACIYDNEQVIQKIKAIKQRDEKKPFPMMVDTVDRLKNIAILNANAKQIFKCLTPGAITLVLEKNPDLPLFVVNQQDSIAIRIPNDENILKLVKCVGKPLLVTSANISNHPATVTVHELLDQIFDKIDYIVEGQCGSKEASTVVDVRNEIKILREGEITQQQIMEVIT